MNGQVGTRKVMAKWEATANSIHRFSKTERTATMMMSGLQHAMSLRSQPSKWERQQEGRKDSSPQPLPCTTWTALLPSETDAGRVEFAVPPTAAVNISLCCIPPSRAQAFFSSQGRRESPEHIRTTTWGVSYDFLKLMMPPTVQCL